MNQFIFNADSRSGNRCFKLSDHYLEIAGSLENKRVSFREIGPVFQRGKRRRIQGIFVPLSLAVLVCVVAWWIDIAIVSPILAFTSIGFMALIDYSPIEFVKMVDRRGNVIAEIFRPAKNAHRYDDFIRELTARGFKASE